MASTRAHSGSLDIPQNPADAPQPPPHRQRSGTVRLRMRSTSSRASPLPAQSSHGARPHSPKVQCSLSENRHYSHSCSDNNRQPPVHFSRLKQSQLQTYVLTSLLRAYTALLTGCASDSPRVRSRLFTQASAPRGKLRPCVRLKASPHWPHAAPLPSYWIYVRKQRPLTSAPLADALVDQDSGHQPAS